MMPSVLDVFVGYDRDEIVAYHTLCASILERSTLPVRFTPINLANLKGVFRRDRLPQQSTEFSFSRFLTPYLSAYAGWSAFMDCDMLARADIAELFALRDERYAVMVCQHDYTPRDTLKFLDNPQTRYAKKNWSSVMLFNNARCRTLTPDFVNTATGLELHQFAWLEDDALIGSLPLEWNWLVGEYPFNPNACIAHFTRGGPYFAGYENCDYADEWHAEQARASSVRQFPQPGA
jgi:lipopolysaccharide biosynthesis glycosyltransferase